MRTGDHGVDILGKFLAMQIDMTIDHHAARTRLSKSNRAAVLSRLILVSALLVDCARSAISAQLDAALQACIGSNGPDQWPVSVKMACACNVSISASQNRALTSPPWRSPASWRGSYHPRLRSWIASAVSGVAARTPHVRPGPGLCPARRVTGR